MLSNIELKAFKCFRDISLPLGPLTLLSGTNASGKSSVMQSLVLLHQTMREHEWSRRLMLNGNSLRLGTVQDVVDKVYGRNGFDLGLTDDGVDYAWEFRGERQHMSLEVVHVRVSGHEDVTPELMTHLVLRYLLPVSPRGASPALAERIRGMTYITAERVGPREVYPLVDPAVGTVVGPTGEFTAGLLHLKSNDQVLAPLALPDQPSTLLGQVRARMRSFFPGSDIRVTPLEGVNAVTLGLLTSDETDFHRPIHVGFGLTQVLPIVVACLAAKQGDLILIENPEVHLHPAGQAKMGQFLAEVAGAGVQVIMETHSDHVLNGVRRAVKAGLPPEKTVLHFFQPRNGNTAQVTTPKLDRAGNINQWPDGFFDQFDKDMNYFAGWGE